MLALFSDGRCRHVDASAEQGGFVVEHELMGETLRLYCTLWRGDSADQALFNLPLPWPFGLNLMTEPIHWALASGAPLAEKKLDELLDAMVVQNEPATVCTPLSLSLNSEMPCVDDKASEVSSEEDDEESLTEEEDDRSDDDDESEQDD